MGAEALLPFFVKTFLHSLEYQRGHPLSNTFLVVGKAKLSKKNLLQFVTKYFYVFLCFLCSCVFFMFYVFMYLCVCFMCLCIYVCVLCVYVFMCVFYVFLCLCVFFMSQFGRAGLNQALILTSTNRDLVPMNHP